ncbi:hypothetical protein ACROYT_G044507 [Oculina patagonica]
MWWRAILEGRPPTSRLRSNVTKEERSAIKTLKQDRNIVIFQADIGAAVVVQNRKDYLDGAYKQLNGKDQNGEEVYHRVPLDSTSDFVNKVKDAVHGALAKDVIDQTTANFLIVENARPGIFRTDSVNQFYSILGCNSHLRKRQNPNRPLQQAHRHPAIPQLDQLPSTAYQNCNTVQLGPDTPPYLFQK